MNTKLQKRILGREDSLFRNDLDAFSYALRDCIKGARFLVLGGAGSIGAAVVRELLRFNPRSIDVVDLNENALADLIRDIRSSNLVGDTCIDTFVLDIGSNLFEKFAYSSSNYDYVFNLSALKHVRSEKDPYTFARMIEVNILSTVRSYKYLASGNTKKYFCVSTDKATNPENLMGATKRIMETFLPAIACDTPISTARFANVAFSNGSLLASFLKRVQKRQPLAAPNDILRYFVSESEAGTLCLFSGILGHSNEIFFPKLSKELHARGFDQIAVDLLEEMGFTPEFCVSESEAIEKTYLIDKEKKWPVLFSKSNTSGEKSIEEFQYSHELEKKRYKTIGVVDNLSYYDEANVQAFVDEFHNITENNLEIKKEHLVELVKRYCAELVHVDKGKSLNEKL